MIVSKFIHNLKIFFTQNFLLYGSKFVNLLDCANYNNHFIFHHVRTVAIMCMVQSSHDSYLVYDDTDDSLYASDDKEQCGHKCTTHNREDGSENAYVLSIPIKL